MPAIFNGTVDNWRAIRSAEFDNAFFTDALPLSKASLAIRSLSSSTNQYALGKETTNGESTVVTFNHDLLKKQVDGKFCVDGSLQLNRELNKLVYTYYYRNQFLVMDTSMALLYEGKTIDTISRAQVEVSQVAGGRKETLSAPPLMVKKGVAPPAIGCSSIRTLWQKMRPRKILRTLRSLMFTISTTVSINSASISTIFQVSDFDTSTSPEINYLLFLNGIS